MIGRELFDGGPDRTGTSFLRAFLRGAPPPTEAADRRAALRRELGPIGGNLNQLARQMNDRDEVLLIGTFADELQATLLDLAGKINVLLGRR